MSAVTKEEAAPKRKGAAEVEAFKKKYAEALEEGRISAAHTATEGWQQLYESHRKNIEKRRREIAGLLHEAATCIERGWGGDEPEEAISSAKKRLSAVLTADSIFNERTIGPVKEAVMRCQEVIAHARREAQSLESNSPLVAKGVLQAIESAIEESPKVTFDEKTGCVLIEELA